jgi:anti-sigma factor RsiW
MTGCDIIRERLLAHDEGELTAEECRGLEAHLATCADCRRDAGLVREMLEQVRVLPVPELPPGSWEGLQATVRRRIAEERPPRPALWARVAARLRRFPALGPAPVLATATALGLLLAIGLVRTQRGPRELPPPAVLDVSEDLAIGQNLELLESLDLLEEIEVLERLELLGQLDGSRRHRMS